MNQIKYSAPIIFIFKAVLLILMISSWLLSCDNDDPIVFSTCDTHSVFETMVPMRDGKELAATLVLPDCPGKYPSILIQTPYNKEGFEQVFLYEEIPLFNNSNYAFIIVDWRGYYASAAAVVPLYNQGLDGYDLVEWIAVQSWSNGSVGMWGVSALGRQQFYTAVEQPPHLTCMIPIFSILNQTYEDIYSGGVLRREYVDMLDIIGYGVSDIYEANPYCNSAWTYMENLRSAEDLTIPALLIAGWWDLHTTQMIQEFKDIQQQASPLASQASKLIIGSWHHMAVGGESTGGDNLTSQEMKFYDSQYFVLTQSLAFFNHHLRKEENGVSTWSDIRYHDYALDQWIEDTSWPPAFLANELWYLQTDHRLSTSKPGESSYSESYTYDPADPSPTIGGPTLNINVSHGPHDQSSAVESRSDCLIFTSDELDSSISVRGKIKAVLYVETDAVDTDFAVRLTDVFPDGCSLLVCDGIQRLKLKEGCAIPQTITPGQIYELSIMFANDLAYTFDTGHQLRLIITSSNYPRFEVNPNNGDDFPGEYPNVVATNSIHFDSNHPSHLIIPVSD